MSTITALEASMRADIGKGASRRLRKTGLIPGIIYGAKQAPISINLQHHKIIKALEDEAFYSRILTLKLDGKDQQVVLKDLQRHPFKKQILHMDFLRVKSDEAIIRTIQLHFINETIAPGIKIGGGTVLHYEKEVEISCLPANLPDFIEVDVGNVELDQVIHFGDLKLPKGVKLASEKDAGLPVVTIHIPKVVEEETETAAPVAIETEITTEKKEDETADAASSDKDKDKDKGKEKGKDKK